MIRFTTLLAVLLMAAACQPQKQDVQVKFGGRAQGTYYEVTYYDAKGRNFQAGIDNLLDDFNLSLSVYEPNSIISRINRDEADVKTDEWFRTVFSKAYEVASLTDGYFDFSVMPLVNAWGFGFTDRMKVSQALIDSLMPLVGYANFRLEGDYIIKDIHGSKLDFNAIAKGYAVDIVGDFLTSKGIKAFLVDIGGEVLARGQKPDGSFWRVGVEKPADDALAARTLKAIVPLKNLAIATSGNYRRFYEHDGIKYAHTINPFTGYPVQHTLLSASVLATDCMTADAFATAFMVMGTEKTIAFLEEHPGLDVFLIYSDENGQLQTWASEGFQSAIENNL